MPVYLFQSDLFELDFATNATLYGVVSVVVALVLTFSYDRLAAQQFRTLKKVHSMCKHL